MRSNLQAVVTAFAVPWNAFVGAFLYLVLLTMIVLGGASPSLAVIATAYMAPVVAYAAFVSLRLAAAGTHHLQSGVRLRPVRSH